MEDRLCGRCGTVIASRHWENGWPIYCRITIGRASRIFDVLSGGSQDGWAECENHAAFRRCDAQQAVIEWHNKDLPPKSWAGRSDAGARIFGDVNGVGFPDEGSYAVSHEEYDRAASAGEFRVSPYHLCFKCHDEFIAMIGIFLGLRQSFDDQEEE